MTIPTPQLDDPLERVGTSLARLERRVSHLESLEAAGAAEVPYVPPPKIPSVDVAIIVDQKANGTNAATINPGAWQTRELNTIYADPAAMVTLAANQFALPVGKYLIEWFVPCYNNVLAQTRLYDVSNAAVVRYGQNAYSNIGAVAVGFAYVDITLSTSYRIEHRVSQAGVGGIACSFGNVEVYTTVKITRINDVGAE